MTYTKEQEQAIFEEGKNILVSAGAGSGKTKVLTERVYRKLKDGISIRNLLVLTFTNAAAKEMKERIRKVLASDSSLKQELEYLDSSYITTFDSFASSIVKKYHTRLNIPHQIEITDDIFIQMKKKEILESILNQYYENPSKEFQTCISHFCLKSDDTFQKEILELHQKLELKYDKDSYIQSLIFKLEDPSWIKECIQEYLSLIHKKKELLQEELEEVISYLEGNPVEKLKEAYLPFIESSTYQEMKSHLPFPSVRISKYPDESIKEKKKELVKIGDEIEELFIYSSEEEMKEMITSTLEDGKIILNIVKELEEKLSSYKKENQIYHYQDIATLARKVIEENSDVRNELTNQFQEIMIDEYQDTSYFQEEFISLISNNNVYMVGDIKQSIYRFRNANPEIFEEKYEDYQNEKDGIKIDLLKNFRSRKEVLHIINQIFNPVMSIHFGGADYQKSHQLEFGFSDYENQKENQNYDIEWITYDKSLLKETKKEEEEAFLAGEDILSKIKNGYQVYDPDQKKLRPAEWKDFAILCDKSTHFDLYKRVLEYLQIPTVIWKEESLTKEYDIYIITNLFRLLLCMKENQFEEDFRYSFASIARSFLWQMSDEELYNTFAYDSFQETSLYQKCLSIIEGMDEMTPRQFFHKVIQEFHYEEKLLSIPNIKENEIRLEYFEKLCQNMEKRGKTIEEFASTLEEMEEEKEYDFRFSTKASESNSCKIMTIHKSKGLEYPICYYIGLDTQFSKREWTKKILLDETYGLILPQVKDFYYDTILKKLCQERKIKEDIGERIRLFYVALTRAREKMIFITPQIKKDSDGKPGDYQKENYSSFLSILSSIKDVLLPYEIKMDHVVSNREYVLPKNRELSFKGGDIITVNELVWEDEIIEEKHYSKESFQLPTKEEKNLLEVGTKVHAILEELDFENPDFSWIEIEDPIKERMIQFIKSPFLQSKLPGDIYKEYEFIKEENNLLQHGIIDLMIDNEKEISIIDYKLKNIDDENYDKQLNGYREYIASKVKKPVRCYLYSILTGESREISYD